jgi:hypothetical protein
MEAQRMEYHGRVKAADVGECIYCRRKPAEVTLSERHVGEWPSLERPWRAAAPALASACDAAPPAERAAGGAVLPLFSALNLCRR